MLGNEAHIRYILAFTETHRACEGKPAGFRENQCQRLKLQNALLPLREEDVFAGRYQHLAVGFAPQEAGLGYFFNKEVFAQVYDRASDSQKEALRLCRVYWETENTAAKTRAGYPPAISAAIPSDDWLSTFGIGFPLYRIGGIHPDYRKLVNLGIGGLVREVETRLAACPDESAAQTYADMREALRLFSHLCARYEGEARQLGKDRLAGALAQIAWDAPATLFEALQLIHLYAIVCGAFNYGRMDDYLGRFLTGDPEELSLLVAFWKTMIERGVTFDGRVILGGQGREDEAAADRFALLAMEASRIHHDILPQLTLRFYDGQNPALLDKAYDNFAQGWVYPILYRDEINIPAVMNAFQLPRSQAEQWMPFGCGEYVLDHCSIGTPSGIINLTAALEAALFGGCDAQGRPLGTPGPYELATFEEVMTQYERQVERLVDALAWQESFEYQMAAKECDFIYLSLLLDDCIARGKPFLSGGVRYLGGTLESYGNTNTADSLTAIRQLVYEEKVLSLDTLRAMLKANFEGYEDWRQRLLACPKYGNDDDTADGMWVRIHEHLCRYTMGQAAQNGLHSYLIVVINNNANTTLGKLTGPCADGRLAGRPFANANNPSGGMDRSGLTAFLNSIAKPSCQIHAGAAQNIKLSRDMFTRHRDKTRMLMTAYFQKAQQAMLNIVNKGELEDAPEDVFALVMRDAGYYAVSGGGLTISGGEPLAQPDYTLALLRLAKEHGVHTVLETSGFAAQTVVRRIAPFVDLFLFDFKADTRRHECLTGVSAELIHANLHLLRAEGHAIVLRCPMVPGVNDTDAFFQELSIASRHNGICLPVQFLPYHNTGCGKARGIGYHRLLQQPNAPEGYAALCETRYHNALRGYYGGI